MTILPCPPPRRCPSSRRLALPRRALALAVLLLAGCSVEPGVRARTAMDPSNPGAPVSSFTPPAMASGMPPAPVASVAPGTVYQCPMHSDVVRNEPGVCPKCGMTLVPRTKESLVH